MTWRCTLSTNTHRLSHKDPLLSLCRVFIGILHSPALYSNHSNGPPNPWPTISLKTTSFDVVGTTRNVLTLLVECIFWYSIYGKYTRTHTHLLCAHGPTAQCVVLCSWAVWGQRGSCYTILVLQRQESCCRWSGVSHSYTIKKSFTAETTHQIITFTNRCDQWRFSEIPELKMDRNCWFFFFFLNRVSAWLYETQLTTGDLLK